MENTNKKDCENCEYKDCCPCKGKSCCPMFTGKCGMYGKKCCAIKMIIKLVLIILIFWCGFKLGLITGFIKAELGNGYNKGGFKMMRGYDNDYAKKIPVKDGTLPVAPKAPIAPQE